jgi:hypothetical protein
MSEAYSFLQSGIYFFLRSAAKTRKDPQRSQVFEVQQVGRRQSHLQGQAN